MSSEQSNQGEKQVVTLEELLARAEELRQSIEVLDATLNTYLSHYRELQLAIDTLKNLDEKPSSGYIVLDRLSSVMIPATIAENWSSSLIVNLGSGFYLKTNKEKALEILSKRLQGLEKTINDIQSRRRLLAEEYTSIQRILNQVFQTQMQQETQ
jgi:prefoldin alpha subunit